MIPIIGTLRPFVVCLFASLALAQADGSTTPEELEIARALRESRLPDSAPASRLVDRIAGAGPDAVAAGIEILVSCRVPETRPDDKPQILSEPQLDLLLSGMARLRPSTLRSAIEARLARDPDGYATRLAAIHVFGTFASAADIPRLVALAPRDPGTEKTILRTSREPLRAACTKILKRDPRAITEFGDVLGRADVSTASVLLDAIATSQDPRALGALFAATPLQPDLGPQIAALATKCGASSDGALNRVFTQWLLAELCTARPEYARTLLQAVGVLDDGSNVPALIDQLSSKDAGVRDSALWALRRVSGLAFPADRAPWLTWIRGEVDWHTNARPRLRLALASSDPKLVVPALRSYGEHRTRRTELAQEVARALADRHPEIRCLACSVLQQIGCVSSSAALTGALQDSDPGVAEAAWKALKAITGLDLPRDPNRIREILLDS
jgi:hypothetical protein